MEVVHQCPDWNKLKEEKKNCSDGERSDKDWEIEKKTLFFNHHVVFDIVHILSDYSVLVRSSESNPDMNKQHATFKFCIEACALVAEGQPEE